MEGRNIAILGIGLLGGSLGLAIKNRWPGAKVVGLVRRQESKTECLAVQAVDEVTLDPLEAVEEADWVFFCTPVHQMAGLARKVFHKLRPDCLVTDVGSVKKTVVSELTPLTAGTGASFVGSHPMAGGEASGVENARPDLFEGAYCVVTPSPDASLEATDRVDRFWREVGCSTLRLTPGEHDRLVANSSHLPHLVASLLAHYILDPEELEAQAKLCATGFLDTTRIASGSPTMWKEIVMANRARLSESLEGLYGELVKIRNAVADGDGDAVLAFLEQAKSRRDAWLESRKH